MIADAAGANVQVLVSLPAASAINLGSRGRHSGLVPVSDPPGGQLGSGGGTIWLLLESWRREGKSAGSLSQWLRASRKLVIHGGGRSRRLPAYAPLGKPFLPMPVMRRSFGQTLDQCLIDFQVDSYLALLSAAPERSRVMVTSGDVLLRLCGEIPSVPETDVLGFGIAVDAEIARDFGVFVRGDHCNGIDCFLQKPSVEEIMASAGDAGFLIDTGAWLLSESAVFTLLAKCGLTERDLSSPDRIPNAYDLYSQFGPALGSRPVCADADIGRIGSAVQPLIGAQFYHFGTCRQMIDSISAIQSSPAGARADERYGLAHPPVFVIDSVLDSEVGRDLGAHVWIDNSCVAHRWRLGSMHIITGVPDNDWPLTLDPGACLDVVPVGTGHCVRGYGFDDRFSGPIGDLATTWFGRPCSEWFDRRGVSLDSGGIDPEADIHEAALFPVVEAVADSGDFVQWLVARRPAYNPTFSERWQRSRRLSAMELNSAADIDALRTQRCARLARALPALQARETQGIFYRLDLHATAELLMHPLGLPAIERSPSAEVRLFGAEADKPPADRRAASTDAMLRAVLVRRLLPGAEGEERAARYEREAFAALRDSLVLREELAVDPQRRLLDDQLIWAHSPVRLDLGGGWTDTPPYCLQHGGHVVNVAVDLNGRPPIQVFARLCSERHIVIRSIDLGVADTISSYEQLDTFAMPGSEFALAKGALALAGFLPRFQSNSCHLTLRDQLGYVFGGGIELSMVAAIPAGSGLGTSSILAATLLAALGELCRLDWDTSQIVQRTMALEQMLTTGGGWQDQVGGAYRGVKVAETSAGPVQRPAVRWLPDHLFTPQYANVTMLLYYTGVTRMAKGILQDIVRGMFLNSAPVLRCLESIRDNAVRSESAIQHGDYFELAAAVGRSWTSNRNLDSGTDPPEIERIVDMIAPDALSAKLLGAGGGGYLLIFAKDAPAAMRIRSRLEHEPPNSLARFVEFSLSHLGLQVTRS